MIRLMAPAGSLLVPWQIPDLDGKAPRGALPPLLPAEETGIAGGMPEEAAVPPSSETEDRTADDPPLADPLAAEVARGHAEGVARGLVEGREMGYAEGFAAGTQAAQAAHAETARRLAALVASLSAPIAAVDRTVEEAVVALALEVARVVIGGEIARSCDSLVRLIRAALAKVPIEMGALEVALNPGDLDLVRALAPEIEEGGTALVGDAAVEAGGALVVGRTEPRDARWHPRPREGLSQVDLSLAERWRNVMLALFDGETE